LKWYNDVRSYTNKEINNMAQMTVRELIEALQELESLGLSDNRVHLQVKSEGETEIRGIVCSEDIFQPAGTVYLVQGDYQRPRNSKAFDATLALGFYPAK
jgi:hypothetical protein